MRGESLGSYRAEVVDEFVVVGIGSSAGAGCGVISFFLTRRLILNCARKEDRMVLISADFGGRMRY